MHIKTGNDLLKLDNQKEAYVKNLYDKINKITGEGQQTALDFKLLKRFVSDFPHLFVLLRFRIPTAEFYLPLLSLVFFHLLRA